MEQAGVALDLSYLGQFSSELSQELSLLENKIFEQSGHPFNINSTQQLQKVLFEELQLKTRSRTKTGAYSTDAAVLETLRDAHPIVASLLDYRQLSKLRSTYVDALPKQVSGRNGRLHGEFNQTVTSTEQALKFESQFTEHSRKDRTGAAHSAGIRAGRSWKCGLAFRRLFPDRTAPIGAHVPG